MPKKKSGVTEYTQLATTPVPQVEQADERQVKNNAGGFVFEVTDEEQLDRFLILGSTSGTYYVGPRKLTQENVHNLSRLIKKNSKLVVNKIVEISDQGRAYKQDQIIFALAACTLSEFDKVKIGEDTRRLAYQAIPLVCRTLSQLTQLIQAHMDLGGGWGSGFRRAISRWFVGKKAEDLAYQFLKYTSRNGWTVRDLLRQAHPFSKTNPAVNAVMDYFAHEGKVRKEELIQHLPPIIPVREELIHSPFTGSNKEVLPSLKKVEKAVKELNVCREMLPTEALTHTTVWQSLLGRMPIHALLRNLGNLTYRKAILPMSNEEAKIVERLNDPEVLRKGRVHPFNVLLSKLTYEQGRGDKGSNTWEPNQRIVRALNEAFYLAFKNTLPTGKRIMIAVDSSGSMSSCPFDNQGIRLASSQLGGLLVVQLLRIEQRVETVAYDSRLFLLGLDKGSSLEDVTRELSRGGGYTDSSLPIRYALEKRIELDGFIIISDGETWCGTKHPFECLKDYRRWINPNARMVALNTCPTRWNMFEPDDAFTLNIVGFDSAAMSLALDFFRDKKVTNNTVVEEEDEG